MTTENVHTQPRPELSFDGCGINGPDKFRTRVCTFTDWGLIANKYGPMFAAAPETAAQRDELREKLAVAESQIANHDTMLEQVRMIERSKGAAQRDELLAALRETLDALYNESAGKLRSHWVSVTMEQAKAAIARAEVKP